MVSPETTYLAKHEVEMEGSPMRSRSLLLVILLVCAAPFLLGAENCADTPGGRFLREIVGRLSTVEAKVEVIAECTCCCDGVLEPVCGADLRTYVNSCEARCAGVHVIGRGECTGTRCGGPDAVQCEAGFFCEVQPGCEDPAAFGVCDETPQGCPRIWDPVCGCDGQTYSNDCERRAAGVSLRHPGECRPPVADCRTNDDCGPREVCLHAPGQCDEIGICERRPEACIQIYDPVCGCDGRTYGNQCEALANGVSVAHRGMCAPTAGCRTNEDCEADAYCARSEGVCSDSARGECRPRPTFCDLILAPVAAPTIPVCGCDGETYEGACFAAANGVNVAHRGSCEFERCGGIAGFVCSNPDAVCIFDAGTCQIVDNLGTCVDLAGACLHVFAPVCGCDGRTYGNQCEATRSGVSIDHVGECDREPNICAGFAGLLCPAGQICVHPIGQCQIADDTGVCRDFPDGCFDIWAPVCGCDRQTYGNECEAARAGAKIAHVGECPKVAPRISTQDLSSLRP